MLFAESMQGDTPMPMPRGFKHSEATKAKMSLAHLGWCPSEETRARMSKAKSANPTRGMLGHTHSEETRCKMSAAQKGRIISEETRRKLRESHKGLRLSEAAKAKVVQALTGRPVSQETRHKLALANIGRIMTVEDRRRMSLAKKGKKGPVSWNKGLTVESDIRMQRLNERSKAAVQQSPNHIEQALQNLLDANFPGEWKYTGDGEVTLHGYAPDFTNINGRKAVIELFGRYWHPESDVKKRTDLFQRFGFSTLVIWEEEPLDHATLLEKIRSFDKVRHALVG